MIAGLIAVSALASTILACESSNEPSETGPELEVVASPTEARLQKDSIVVAITLRNNQNRKFEVWGFHSAVHSLETDTVIYRRLAITRGIEVAAWDSLHRDTSEILSDIFTEVGEYYYELLITSAENDSVVGGDTVTIVQ